MKIETDWDHSSTKLIDAPEHGKSAQTTTGKVIYLLPNMISELKW